MNNENQIGTLEDMTKESFEKRPTQATEAIEEYLVNLRDENEEEAKALESKLEKSEKYLEQFKVAITHTSLMIFLMSIKASNLASQSESVERNEVQEIINQIKIDFDKYVREFLLFARQDDKDIYDMRLFYMNGLTGSELGLDQIDEEMYESKDERESAKEKAKVQLAKYDELLNTLRKQYTDTKIHLQ